MDVLITNWHVKVEDYIHMNRYIYVSYYILHTMHGTRLEGAIDT